MLAHSDHRRHQNYAAVPQRATTPNSLDYDVWAEMLIKSNRNSFGRHDIDQNFGPWAARRPLPQLAVAAGDEVKSAPPTITRAQMIERYRQEMMELVRNMPKEEEEEVAPYELSLRDIVESPAAKRSVEETADDNGDMKRKQMAVSRGQNRGPAGFLMRAFMPRVRAVLGGRKSIAGVGGGKGAKVSPKPSNSDCEERSCSDGSCESSGRKIRGGTGSCYLFFHKSRSKSMEI